MIQKSREIFGAEDLLTMLDSKAILTLALTTGTFKKMHSKAYPWRFQTWHRFLMYIENKRLYDTAIYLKKYKKFSYFFK